MYIHTAYYRSSSVSLFSSSPSSSWARTFTSTIFTSFKAFSSLLNALVQRLPVLSSLSSSSSTTITTSWSLHLSPTINHLQSYECISHISINALFYLLSFIFLSLCSHKLLLPLYTFT